MKEKTTAGNFSLENKNKKKLKNHFLKLYFKAFN